MPPVPAAVPEIYAGSAGKTVDVYKRQFFNSCVVTGLTILFTILFSLMAAYALERMIWKGRKQINALFMLGLTVPIHAAILPIFIILRKFHMLNSYQSLIVPYVAFALAMAIMICSSFMISIPVELEESACIDGAGIYKIFWVIICPLMKPAFASVAIFTFLQAWNELMFAKMCIRDRQQAEWRLTPRRPWCSPCILILYRNPLKKERQSA